MQDVSRRGYRIHAMVGAIATSISTVLPVFLVGALAVQLRDDLGITDAQIGAATAIFFAASAVTSAVAGRLVQFRLGPAAGMRLATVVALVAAVTIAFTVREIATLFGLLALAGVANAFAQPSANVLVTESIPRSRLGLAFAAKQSAVVLGALVGGLAVPLVAIPFGWRWCYAGAAALCVIALILTPNHPRLSGGRGSDVERPRVSRGVYGRLVLLSVGAGLGAMAAVSLGAFLVATAVEVGVGDGAAGLVLAGGSLLIVVVRLVIGASADRHDWGRNRPVTVVATMLLLGSVGFALIGINGVATLLVGTAIACVAGWGWPGLFNYSVVRYHSALPGLATGVTQTGIYVGAIMGPIVFGAIADSSGYGAAWLYAGAAAALAGGVLVIASIRLQLSETGDGQGRWSATLRAGDPAQNS